VENNPIISSNENTAADSDNFTEKPPIDVYKEPSDNKYPSYNVDGDNYTKKIDPSISGVGDISPISAQQPSPVVGTVTSDSNIKEGTNSFASFSKRSWAVFIDSLIIGSISILFSLPTYISFFKNFASSIASGSGSEYLVPQTGTSNLIFTILSIIGTIIGIIYPIYFIGKFGATPGKKAMKIKVVEVNSNQNPGYLKAFLRETIGKFISSLIFFVGYLWVIWDKDKQAWHDKIAGTVVVNV